MQHERFNITPVGSGVRLQAKAGPEKRELDVYRGEGDVLWAVAGCQRYDLGEFRRNARKIALAGVDGTLGHGGDFLRECTFCKPWYDVGVYSPAAQHNYLERLLIEALDVGEQAVLEGERGAKIAARSPVQVEVYRGVSTIVAVDPPTGQVARAYVDVDRTIRVEIGCQDRMITDWENNAAELVEDHLITEPYDCPVCEGACPAGRMWNAGFRTTEQVHEYALAQLTTFLDRVRQEFDSPATVTEGTL